MRHIILGKTTMMCLLCFVRKGYEKNEKTFKNVNFVDKLSRVFDNIIAFADMFK